MMGDPMAKAIATVAVCAAAAVSMVATNGTTAYAAADAERGEVA